MTLVKRVLPKVVGFLRFPPTENVDRVGWDYPFLTLSLLLRSVIRQSHEVAVRGALLKPSKLVNF